MFSPSTWTTEAQVCREQAPGHWIALIVLIETFARRRPGRQGAKARIMLRALTVSDCGQVSQRGNHESCQQPCEHAEADL